MAIFFYENRFKMTPQPLAKTVTINKMDETEELLIAAKQMMKNIKELEKKVSKQKESENSNESEKKTKKLEELLLYAEERVYLNEKGVNNLNQYTRALLFER